MLSSSFPHLQTYLRTLAFLPILLQFIVFVSFVGVSFPTQNLTSISAFADGVFLINRFVYTVLLLCKILQSLHGLFMIHLALPIVRPIIFTLWYHCSSFITSICTIALSVPFLVVFNLCFIYIPKTPGF